VDTQTLRNTTDIHAINNAKYEIADLTYVDVHIDGLTRPVKVLHD